MMRNQGGFSLIQVMVAVAIIGALSLGVISIVQLVYKQQKLMNKTMNVSQLNDDLKLILDDKALCSCNFQSLNTFDSTAVSPSVDINEMLLDCSVSTSFLVKQNQPYANTNLIVKEIKFNNIKPTQPGGAQYIGELTVYFKKIEGLPVLKPLTIKQKVNTSTTSPITAKKIIGCGSVAGEVSSSPHYGGWGGNGYQVDCRQGYFVSGINTRSGALIDGFSINCASYNDHNQKYSGAHVGGTGGGNASLNCPADSYALGFMGRAAAQVDQLRLKCRNKNTSAVTLTPTSGGGGGTPFSYDCPSDSYIIGFVGRQGTLLDGIKAVCLTLK